MLTKKNSIGKFHFILLYHYVRRILGNFLKSLWVRQKGGKIFPWGYLIQIRSLDFVLYG